MQDSPHNSTLCVLEALLFFIIFYSLKNILLSRSLCSHEYKHNCHIFLSVTIKLLLFLQHFMHLFHFVDYSNIDIIDMDAFFFIYV